MRFLFLSLMLLSGMAYGQRAIADLKLDNKISVLHDKAFFMFPQTAANVARKTNIMAVDPNEDRETRIVMDIGEKRLVFFAEELYVTADKKMASIIEADNKKDFKVKVLNKNDGLLSVLSTPLTFDSTENAILVNSLMVKTQDNSVFRINAYIDLHAYLDKKEYVELTEKVFASLSKGSRELVTKARTEEIPVLGGKKKLSIDLPAGYLVSKDEKADFSVLRFRKIKDFSDTTWVNLIVYLGHHPNYLSRDYGFAESQQNKVNGTFRGETKEWFLYKNEEQHIFLKEQQFPANDLEEGLIIHVAMTGSQLPFIDELNKIVAAIKFVN